MARNIALLKKGEDPVGAPDFTLPVSILAQIIESLKVDIVAQSIPKLEVNIASVSSGVTFNVAQSGAWTINAVQSGAWTINAVQSGTWTVNVSGTVNVNITNTSLNVYVTNSSLTVTVSGTANVYVTNTSLTITGNVNVTNTSLNVYVTNSTLTVSVSGTANVYVTNSSLTVTVSGTANVNIANAIASISSIRLMDSGTLKRAVGIASNSYVTLYTVPSGMKFYIYSISLNVWHYVSGFHDGAVGVYDGSTYYWIIELSGPDAVDHMNEALSFTLTSIPAGWRIVVYANSSSYAEAAVLGVEISA
jgi:hypothetical protein